MTSQRRTSLRSRLQRDWSRMELVDTAETKQLQMEVTLFGRMFRRFYKSVGSPTGEL